MPSPSDLSTARDFPEKYDTQGNTDNLLRHAFHNAPIGMAIISSTGELLTVNPALCAMLGYSEQELLALDFMSVTHPEDLQIELDLSARVWAGEIDSFQIEKRYLHKQGHTVPGLLSASVVRDPNGGALYGIGQVQDITELRIREEKISEHSAIQARLLQRLMHAQEAERRQLSMDLHDGPLQSLGVALLAADRALLRMSRGENALVEMELQMLRNNLRETVSEVRAVLADLSLEVLTTYGLATALQGHAERLSNVTGIKAEMNTSIGIRLRSDLELLMYRLAQEALANVSKHSGATAVQITLEQSEERVRLTIRDNGRGFDLREARRRYEDGRGLGLRSMEQRIRAAGGDIQIQTAPGNGTTLDFWCPLQTGEGSLRKRPRPY